MIYLFLILYFCKIVKEKGAAGFGIFNGIFSHQCITYNEGTICKFEDGKITIKKRDLENLGDKWELNSYNVYYENGNKREIYDYSINPFLTGTKWPEWPTKEIIDKVKLKYGGWQKSEAMPTKRK